MAWSGGFRLSLLYGQLRLWEIAGATESGLDGGYDEHPESLGINPARYFFSLFHSEESCACLGTEKECK